MKTKLVLSLFTVLYFFTSSAYSQRTDDLLSKKEMYREFDYITSFVEEVNPHLPIYKKMMNYDVVKEMKKNRKSIRKIDNWADYCRLLDKILSKIPEQHTRLLLSDDVTDYYIRIYPYLNDSLFILNSGRVNRDFELFPTPNALSEAVRVYQINTIYIDGKIYNTHSFKTINTQTGEENTVKSGWELTKINGCPIPKFLKKNAYDYYFRDYNRWDVKNNICYNKFPTSYTGSFSNKIGDSTVMRNDLRLTFITPSSEEINLTYVFKDPSHVINRNFFGFDDPEWSWIKEYGKVDKSKVLYFDSILYVKMKSMSDLDFFKEEIAKYQGMTIKKVVIDVRGNGGGSDNVWSGVLKSIVDTTLCRRGIIGIADNDIYRKNSFLLSPYIGDYPFDSLEIYKDPFMKRKYRLLSDGKHCMEFIPDSNSLNYKGQIYLLHDRKSFSASTAFLTFALGEDRVVAVGEHMDV